MMKRSDKLTVSRFRVEALRDTVALAKLSKSQTTRDWAEGVEFALDVLFKKLPKEAEIG